MRKGYQSRAAALLASPARVKRLLGQTGTLLAAGHGLPDALQSLRTEVVTSMDLVRAWLRGEYAGVERSTIVMIVAALLYLVAPADAVPDFLPAVGLLDDAAVLAAVLGRLQSELGAFRAWRSRTQPAYPVPVLTDGE